MAKLHDKEATRFQHNLWYELHNFPTLTKDEILLFIFLCHHDGTERNGLFVLNKFKIASTMRITPIEVESGLNVLHDNALVIQDLDLIYIPWVSLEQGFNTLNDRYWIQKVRNGLKWNKHPSARGSPYPNLAYDRWRSDHMQIIAEFYKIEEDKKKNGEKSP